MDTNTITSDIKPNEEEHNQIILIQQHDFNRVITSNLKGNLNQRKSPQTSWFVTTIKNLFSRPIRDLRHLVFSFNQKQEDDEQIINILSNFNGYHQ